MINSLINFQLIIFLSQKGFNPLFTIHHLRTNPIQVLMQLHLIKIYYHNIYIFVLILFPHVFHQILTQTSIYPKFYHIIDIFVMDCNDQLVALKGLKLI